ncbi:CypX, Cytochrome P450 [Pyrenophora tritici-repentis]|uniref:Cytochrome P450 n=2 Tax=Pyrenophora tritici-repentis TaxID=45151 RepID=A0A2W1GKY2_9PLEO|nr:Cytochrome P450 [Pyrenophora tritici-repentis]KAI1580090.1 CypX Cytochrome P450 [Pyrenophora tritici-repentis]KAI1669273.1 Cytochrome P450 [Pyrenophora tritici-repentis]KAI1683850.1 Cytochrome P450 [Pyrenophora tritici-repentis]PWO20911.1 PotE, Amino acid transporter [Pyrenophora tritici-repentis]
MAAKLSFPTVREGSHYDPLLFKAAAALVALGVFLIMRFIYWYLKASKQFPGPPVKSFLQGNLDQTMTDDIHEKWRAWHIQYGPIFQTWNGPWDRTIYVGKPSLISKIANQNWPKAPAQYEGFKPLSGSALFAQMDHTRWHSQRKALAPAFGPAVVNAQFSSLARYLTQFVEILDNAALNSRVLDISLLNVLLTLDFIGEVAFGIDLHAMEQGESCRVMQIFQTVLPELMKCGLFPLHAKIPVLKSTRDMHAAIAELRSMADHAVQKCRENDTPDSKPAKRIFEILAKQRDIEGQYLFNMKELFLHYEVLRNPEVMKKLRKELDNVIPADCVTPSIEQVKLPYLNRVIKETLCMHGPGSGTFRYCSQDTEIDGIVLPANTTIALWNPQVHRDPRIWGPKANEFNPDRWGDDMPSRTPGSYFPFSYGPRNCLGQGLAMLQMSFALATLFRRYDLSIEPGFEIGIFA